MKKARPLNINQAKSKRSLARLYTCTTTAALKGTRNMTLMDVVFTGLRPGKFLP